MLLENTGLVSIFMLMILNYISQQDQIKLSKLTECVKNKKKLDDQQFSPIKFRYDWNITYWTKKLYT